MQYHFEKFSNRNSTKNAPCEFDHFDMFGFDMILRMDWLFQNQAFMDCLLKRIIFEYVNREVFSFQASQSIFPPHIILVIQAT